MGPDKSLLPHPGDRGIKITRNVAQYLSDCTLQHARRQSSFVSLNSCIVSLLYAYKHNISKMKHKQNNVLELDHFFYSVIIFPASVCVNNYA